MIDKERFDREIGQYIESWRVPVTIQFGAVFELLEGSRREPLYALGVVTDIREGVGFKGCSLIRGQVSAQTGTTLPDLIGGGGDMSRSNILRMTEEILTLDQFLAGIKEGLLEPPSPEDPYWVDERKYVEEMLRKGSRILPGKLYL